MLRLFSTLFIIAGSAIAGISHAADTSKVLADVNGTSITSTMLESYIQQRGMRSAQLRDQQRVALLQELVSRELIYQDGVKAGIDKKSEVIDAIQNQRINIVASATLNEKTNVGKITEEDLKTEYTAQMKKLGGTEYKARHILVKDEAEAKAIIQDLDKGADFIATAKAKSTGPNTKDGGDLGWFSPTQMVQPFSEAVAKLEKGSYTKSPVHTDFGWHVILLEDTRALQPPAYEAVREQLLNGMRGERIETYLQTLREKAKIDIKQ